MESASSLDRLLIFLDRLRDVHDRAAGGTVAADDRASLADEASTLAEHVLPQLPGLCREDGRELSAIEVFLLALFFHRRTSGRREAMLGSELVGHLHLVGIDRSEALAALAPESRLRNAKWLRQKRLRDGHDPLDCAFAPCARALNLFWSAQPADTEGSEPSTAEPPLSGEGPYASEEEYLWDLFAWRNLCLKRCQALIPNEGTPPAASPELEGACQQARAAQLQIRARLGASVGGRTFALEAFRREHALGQDHLLVLVHLLASEVLEAEPYLAALECLRLVCETRNDLFLKRSLFRAKGRLRHRGIVLADGPDDDKALTASLSLSEWATEQLLAGVLAGPRIRDDALDRFLRD